MKRIINLLAACCLLSMSCQSTESMSDDAVTADTSFVGTFSAEHSIESINSLILKVATLKYETVGAELR